MQTGLIGCTVCNIGFLALDQLNDVVKEQWVAVISVLFMVAHVTIYNIGPGPIMWFICSEMTPQSARSIGATLCLITNSIGLIVLNFIVPPINDAIGTWLFLLFIVPTIVLTVIIYFMLPETKNREV